MERSIALLSGLGGSAQGPEWRGNALMIRTVKVQGRPEPSVAL